MKPLLNKTKKCQTCGRLHERLPAKNRPWIDAGKLLGYFFECDCNSTMLVKAEHVKVA